MTAVFEVVWRWGDTILDVQYVHDPPAETRLGLVDVIARRTSLPARSLAYARTDDRRVLPYVGIALLAHLAVWGVATSQTVEPITKPRPLVTRIAPFVDHSPDTKSPGRGAAMTGDRGRAGDAHQRSKSGHIAIAANAASAKIAAIEQARYASILGSTSFDQLKTLTGSADLSSGFDGATINANLIGDEGAAHGTFGLALSGERHGAAGEWDTIGVGEHRGFSNGDGHGEGWGSDVGPELHEIPWIRIHLCSASDDCVAFGDLDQQVILRRVWRKAHDLEQCWTLNYGSARHMIVDFKIGRSGRVEKITAPLECIATIYKSIRFPRSRDIGTQVRHVLEFEIHKTYMSSG